MDDIIKLGDFSAMRSPNGRFQRTIKSTPIRHNFDAVELGRGPAEAIRDAIEAGIRGISAQVSKGTVAIRKRAGIMSTTLFNATGHLAAAIAAEVMSGDSWGIKAPDDRLNDNATFQPGAFDLMLQKLVELVPALQDPLSVPDVKLAIEETLRILFPR